MGKYNAYQKAEGLTDYCAHSRLLRIQDPFGKLIVKTKTHAVIDSQNNIKFLAFFKSCVVRNDRIFKIISFNPHD